MALWAHADEGPSAAMWGTSRFAPLRPRTIWLLGSASLGLFAGWLMMMARQRQVDFLVYRMGGQHVFGSGLYSSSVTYQTRHLPFTYPPLAAFLFWPVSHLSTFASGLVWDAVDLAALTALISVSIAAAKGKDLAPSDWRSALLLLIPLGFLLFPVREDLELGQINILLVLMVVVDLAAAISWRGRKLPKGMLTGLAAALKLTPLVFLPYLLATRQWRAARNMAITCVVATAALFVVAPGASWLYFSKDVFEVNRIGNAGQVIDQTIRAAIGRAGFSPSSVLGDLIALAVVCGGLALAVQAHRRSSALLGVLVCAATGLLVSPISWPHHYVWILPALVWLVAGSDRPAKGVYWAAAATLPFMVIPATAPGEVNVLWYMRENAYVLSTLVFLSLVAVMLWSRRRTVDRPEPAAHTDHLGGGLVTAAHSTPSLEQVGEDERFGTAQAGYGPPALTTSPAPLRR